MGYNHHDYGDSVRVYGEFRDAVLGVLLDPTAVNLSIRTPAGVVSTLVYGTDAIVRESEGLYYADISLTASGTWFYRWWSTGTGQASEERQFVVRAAQAQ